MVVNDKSSVRATGGCLCEEGLADMIWEKGNFTISSEKKHVDSFYRKSGFEEMSTLKFMARNWNM